MTRTELGYSDIRGLRSEDIGNTEGKYGSIATMLEYWFIEYVKALNSQGYTIPIDRHQFNQYLNHLRSAKPEAGQHYYVLEHMQQQGCFAPIGIFGFEETIQPEINEVLRRTYPEDLLPDATVAQARFLFIQPEGFRNIQRPKRGAGKLMTYVYYQAYEMGYDYLAFVNHERFWGKSRELHSSTRGTEEMCVIDSQGQKCSVYIVSLCDFFNNLNLSSDSDIEHVELPPSKGIDPRLLEMRITTK